MPLYRQGVLLSIIGAAAQLSQPQQSSAFAPPSPGQIAAGEIGRQLSQISMETIRRNMDIRPTLRIEAGTSFYIFLARDLVLEGPYVDQRGGSLAVGIAAEIPRHGVDPAMHTDRELPKADRSV